MKIYKTADLAEVHQHPIKKEKIYISGRYGGSFIFSNNKLSFELYDVKTQLDCFCIIGGKVYRRVDITEEETRALLLNEQNIKINLPEIFIENINPSANLSYKFDVFTSYLSNYPEDYDNSLVVFDAQSKSLIHKPIKAIYHKKIDKSVYGFDRSQNEFFKRNLKLEREWGFTPCFNTNKSSDPILLKNVLITFIGPKEESMFTENSKPRLTFSGGSVFGFHDLDGTVIWELGIPEAIDDMRLHNDMLYIAIYDQLRVINPLNGEIIKVIETGTSLPDYRQFSAHVFVDDNFIFYTHAEDEILIIYDVNTYKLVHKVSLPEGHQPQWHQFTDENTGKHYFTVNNNSQYVARSPVLEVDPANLLSHVEFEVEPEKTVEFMSVNGDDSQQELVISMTSESLDDALRFGEIHTRDLTQHHSFNHYGMSFAGRVPTDTFNGTVRFVLSGCNADKTLITERLAIMEKRFALWVEDEGFYACTDNSILTHLVTEYKA